MVKGMVKELTLVRWKKICWRIQGW